jgi:hypothetical protein
MVNLIMSNSLEKDNLSTNSPANSTNDNDVFSDINYICKSTSLIVDSLQKGLDVAQLPNGDVVITEVKTVNTHYVWDKNKQKMFKIGQN